MNQPITNISQANEELALALAQLSRVQAFLDSFRDVLGQFSAPAQVSDADAAARAAGRQPDRMTLADRVLLLVQECGRPVWPATVAAEYQRRQWPAPRSGTVYDAVNGAMSYLLHRRRALHRNEQGYFLPTQILSEPVSGKKPAAERGRGTPAASASTHADNRVRSGRRR